METPVNLRGNSLLSPDEDNSSNHKVSMPTIDLLMTSSDTPDPPDSTATSGNHATTTTITTTTTPLSPSSLPTTPAPPDAPKTASSSCQHQLTNPPRSNQVRTVMLSGVPIVALVIDGKERLCLAQISNTLLKSFSYNEIHNRRVALGITCVQCTPVQLEILRRAGAMPISSRRCGMITKREAERLCKSFLTENTPPKLPDNFAFDVYHQCAWGCRGSFVPSRYNSSRAKCIKCNFCGLFFSPNKFIFHSHRLPDSKYTQPDAASFNSWRRHLKLAGDPGEETTHAWEDVKAMFNGGSRRRVMMSHTNSACGRFHLVKRSRVIDESAPVVKTSTPEIDKSPYLPVMPYPSKTYPPPPPQQPPTSPYLSRNATDSCIRQGFAEYMWGASKQVSPFVPSPYHTFASLPPPPPPPCNNNNTKLSPDDLSSDCTTDVGTPRPHSSCSRESTVTSDQRGATSDTDDVTLYPIIRQNSSKLSPMPTGYLSAFRPVIRAPPYSIPPPTPPTEEGRVTSSTRAGRDSVASSTGGAVTSSSDGENVDIEMTTDDERGDPTDTPHPQPSPRSPPPSLVPMIPPTTTTKMAFVSMEDALNCNKQVSPVGLNLTSPGKLLTDVSDSQQAKLSCLSKEELEEILVHETHARRRAEKEFQLMKESFQEQVKREVAYREEMMAKQLHLVRGRDAGPRSVCITTPIDALPRIGAGEGSEIRRLAETQRSSRRSTPFLVQDVDFAAMYRMRLQAHAPPMNPIFPPPYQPPQQQQQQQQPHHQQQHSNKQCECCLTTPTKPRDILLTQNGLHDHLRFHLFSNSNDLFGASWTTL